MISYTQDEIVSATDAVRNFSSVLKSISTKAKEKVVIVKNNRFEAVVLNIEQYEKMVKAVEILENIYNKKRIK